MLNLRLGAIVASNSPHSHFYKHFKTSAGERHFAALTSHLGEWHFIKLGEQFDCVLEWLNQSKDTFNCYLIHFFSDKEAFIINSSFKEDLTSAPFRILDFGLEVSSFSSLKSQMEQIRLPDKEMLSLIMECGKKMLGSRTYKKLLELHSTSQFHDTSFEFSVYEAMRELGCRSSERINRAAIRHKKILSKLKQIVVNENA